MMPCLIKRFALALLSMAYLSGCTPISQNPGYDSVSQTMDVDSQLMSAAHSVQDSLRTLAASKAQNITNAINTEPLLTPQGGMGQRATIDWTGPIEPLLYGLADLSKYSVKVLGPSPSIPIIVSMTVQDRQIADILKDAGLQAGKRANLVVYPTTRIIELRYSPA